MALSVGTLSWLHRRRTPSRTRVDAFCCMGKQYGRAVWPSTSIRTYGFRSVHLLNLEKIQRRLAWPLRKDDTQYLLKSISFFYDYYKNVTSRTLLCPRPVRLCHRFGGTNADMTTTRASSARRRRIIHHLARVRHRRRNQPTGGGRLLVVILLLVIKIVVSMWRHHHHHQNHLERTSS